MARSDDLTWLYPETLYIPTGVTAVVPPLPGQAGVILKYGAGGSLLVQGISQVTGVSSPSYGSTYAAAQQYLLGTSEILNMNLSGPLSLVATGSTCTAYLLRGLTT